MSKPSEPVMLPVERYALTAADKARFAGELELGLVKPSDPVLSCVAAAVDIAQIAAPQTQALIGRMRAAAQGQRAGKHARKRTGRGLVGLAAPQIGEAVRVMLIDTQVGADRKSLGKLECFINPEVVWRSHETAEGREGCFSSGLVWGMVRRPIAVKIRAFNAAGKPVERIFEGFTARIVQHEIDHLNGVRFPDRIRSDRKRHWVHTEELDRYVARYKSWPRHCTRKRWHAFIAPAPK